MARRRPPRGRSPPTRARLACLAVLLALAALAALPAARAQLAAEDLYAPDAPADADGTADGLKGDANETEADYGGTGDGADADSVEAPPSYEEMVQELLNPTDASAQQVAEPPPSLDLNALGLETKFPDSPRVGDGLSVSTGKTFSDLEQDVLELEKRLGATGGVGGNGTDAGSVGSNATNATAGTAEDAADDAADDATDDAAVTSDDLMTNPRAFLYDKDTQGEYVDPRLACKRGCVDPALDVNLVWCFDAVKYKYCNRVVTDKPTVSVLDMEEGAIAAYMALAQRVPTPNAPECRPMLRKWMCYEFFMRCNTDETAYYPVCASTCAAAKYACGSPDFIECDQEVEELDGNAPDAWYDSNGKYIRGVKPDGREGSPVFETDVLRCTGGGSGLTRRGAVIATLFAASLATLHTPSYA